MTRALLAISGSAAGLLPRPFLELSRTFDTLWRRLSDAARRGYHPERHYMRGPGPAWHAKHDPSA